MKFKFAHLADCHVGSWGHPLMKELSISAFERAVKTVIDEQCDFVLIAGDLFDTPLPSVDVFERVIKSLKQLRKNNIPVYAIAGSHDFSVSNKTFLRILSSVGLINNTTVVKKLDENELRLDFVVDEKTGVKIAGLLGKRNSLDLELYKILNRDSLEKEQGFKIFMFHNAVDELKSKEFSNVKGIPLSLFPKGFDYYAGGHIHYVFDEDVEGYGRFVFPGPTFPTNFEELERLHKGSFFIVEVDDGTLTTRKQDLIMKNVRCFKFDATGLSGQELTQRVLDELSNEEFFDTIVLLRFEGKLTTSITEVDFNKITEVIKNKSAYYVMRNTSKLMSNDYEEVFVEVRTPKEIEEDVISNNIGKLFEDTEKEKQFVYSLLDILAKDKKEGETEKDYEKRLKEELSRALNF